MIEIDASHAIARWLMTSGERVMSKSGPNRRVIIRSRWVRDWARGVQLSRLIPVGHAAGALAAWFRCAPHNVKCSSRMSGGAPPRSCDAAATRRSNHSFVAPTITVLNTCAKFARLLFWPAVIYPRERRWYAPRRHRDIQIAFDPTFSFICWSTTKSRTDPKMELSISEILFWLRSTFYILA